MQKLGLLEPGQIPPMPEHQPRFDDPEPLGVCFFRTRVSADLSGMMLARTFFGRSEVCDSSFKDPDLSESTLCWCDFIRVDFSDACLRASDLRASTFAQTSFARCDLSEADLRRSDFAACIFADAKMCGTKLTSRQLHQLMLSPRQRAEVDLQADDGDEPGGG